MAATGALSTRGAVWRLAVAAAVALVVRAYLIAVLPVISRDGVVFIRYAQGLQVDAACEMRQQKQHPLYPLAIAATHKAVSPLGLAGLDPRTRWVVAGQTVTVVSGLALILAVYALTTVLFDKSVGVVAAACAALVPEFCAYGVDVLSDSLHLALYVFGLTLAVSGVRRRSWARFGAAGLLSGLAYLTRPEGGEVAVVAAAGACLVHGWPFRLRFGAAAACLAGFLLAAAPYMAVTGRLVQKKPASRFLKAAWKTAPAPAAIPPSPDQQRIRDADTTPPGGRFAYAGAGAGVSVLPPAEAFAGFRTIGGIARALGKVLMNWARSLRVMYLLPAVAWLFLVGRRPVPGAGRRLVVAAGVVHIVICVRLIHAFDYWQLFSVRHTLVLAALTLPWTAAGLVALAAHVQHAMKPPRPGIVWLPLAAIVIGPTLPWLLRTPNRDDAYMREAGDWIARTYPQPQRILTDQWQVPFYANGILCERDEPGGRAPWSGFPNMRIFAEWVRTARPDLVVLDEYRLRRRDKVFFDHLEPLLAPAGPLRLVHAVSQLDDPKRPRRALIYEVRP